MGAVRPFFRKLLRSGRDDSENMEIDEIRSAYPSTPESGYHAWGAGETEETFILSVPSGRKFHLKHILVNNDDGVPNKIIIYDGPGTSVPVAPITVNASQTVIIDNVVGWIFQSHVYASVTGSLMQVRVGGLLASA